MDRKIRIDEQGHFYLDEHDISPFVVDHKVISNERVSVVLLGDVEAPAPKKKPRAKKAVKNGNR